MTKCTVLTCTRRRDDRFLVVYRMPGAITGSAISDRELREGQSITVKDGVVQ
ncbi:MAG: hypothetical protein ACK4FB_08000 [Brevundimonas sp.]|uniref:hypothetical protein n=1 Tax=Brevundimonas sp. TaxID=1871086 RepID=UPI0039196BC8